MVLSRLRILVIAVCSLVGLHFLFAAVSPDYRQRTALVPWTKDGFYDANEGSYVRTYAPQLNETEPGRRANAVFVVLARNSEVSEHKQASAQSRHSAEDPIPCSRSGAFSSLCATCKHPVSAPIPVWNSSIPTQRGPFQSQVSLPHRLPQRRTVRRHI
jgi:hypothetical protein